MRAFYISKNNRIDSVPSIQIGNTLGFNIPEEHYLLAVVDDSGNYTMPIDMAVSDFENLFCNEHQQADYIGFMQTAETSPAGFRRYQDLVGKEYVYSHVSTMGDFQGFDTYFEIWLKLGIADYGYRMYRYNKETLAHTCATSVYGSAEGTTSHKFSIGTAPTDKYPWFAYITYWNGDINSPIAVIIPGDANRGTYPTTKSTIEAFETGDFNTGAEIKEGQAAIDFVEQYGFVWPEIETFKI